MEKKIEKVREERKHHTKENGMEIRGTGEAQLLGFIGIKNKFCG